jgi:hypothetical protein
MNAQLGRRTYASAILIEFRSEQFTAIAIHG